MNRHSVARWVFLLCMLTSAPLAAQPAGGLPAATIEKVQAAISSEMARQGIPGLSAAIVTDHRLRWSSGYGLADLENFVTATPATVYRLGSSSESVLRKPPRVPSPSESGAIKERGEARPRSMVVPRPATQIPSLAAGRRPRGLP